jgi:DNA-binding CsgD family transcriptional regulator
MRITYDGQPMLAFFHGGRGGGEFVLMNEHYQVVSYLRAGNGLEANVHELTITPENTALIGAFLRVKVNLTAFGGKAGQVVDDYVVQEIDVATGNVLFSWNSLGHVPVTNVYRFGKAPFDGSPHSLGITPHRCRHAEEEVAGLVAQALSNRQIADRLVLSERTVETHVRSILAKLSFSTRTEIATWVLRTSAASPGPAPERG